MAAPIFHIVFAYIALGYLPSSIDKAEFIRGTSFPDIRYMANIPRKKTHLTPVTWERIANERSSFKAGMMFHNLLDEIRIKELEKSYYDKQANNNQNRLSQKMAEDVLIYSKLSPDEWEEIAEYFNTISPEAKSFGVKEYISKKWFTALSKYVSKQPDEKSVLKFLKSTNRGGKIDMNITYFKELLSDIKLKERISYLLQNFKKFATSY